MTIFGGKDGLSENDYKLIFNQFRRKIYNFLYYKCGDGDTADDLTQNTFIALWENRALVRSDTVQSYLYKIAENLFLNELKHRKIVQNFHLERKSDEPLSESPEFLQEEHEFREKMDKILASIPENSRSVFLMNRIDDMTYNDIANALNISVKAIEKRMKIALDILREASLKV